MNGVFSRTSSTTGAICEAVNSSPSLGTELCFTAMATPQQVSTRQNFRTILGPPASNFRRSGELRCATISLHFSWRPHAPLLDGYCSAHDRFGQLDLCAIEAPRKMGGAHRSRFQGSHREIPRHLPASL